jgi:protocatechuate 3,4-dioxygenase, alpha subunit
MSRVPTASQTVGPFFNFALASDKSQGGLARQDAEGEHIKLLVRVTDGDGSPTPGDSMIELWQVDSLGRYATEANPSFGGFGRLETDEDGTCFFETVKPGRVDGQAPHINVIVFARGLLRHLHTRVYFDGDPANPGDSVLALVPEERRSTLMAMQVPDQANTWRFDIRLQGESETVFFDL